MPLPGRPGGERSRQSGQRIGNVAGGGGSGGRAGHGTVQARVSVRMAGLASCSLSLLLRARFKLVNVKVIFLGIIFEGGECKHKSSFSLVFMKRFVYLCITNTYKYIRLVVSVF